MSSGTFPKDTKCSFSREVLYEWYPINKESFSFGECLDDFVEWFDVPNFDLGVQVFGDDEDHEVDVNGLQFRFLINIVDVFSNGLPKVLLRICWLSCGTQRRNIKYRELDIGINLVDWWNAVNQ